jgi:multidrug transporter EmrE-like cation transporter
VVAGVRVRGGSINAAQLASLAVLVSGIVAIKLVAVH